MLSASRRLMPQQQQQAVARSGQTLCRPSVARPAAAVRVSAASSAAKRQQPDTSAPAPAAKLARAAVAAAAAAAAAVALVAATTVAAVPAALADTPDYGPWTLINMTQFPVELSVQYARSPTCTDTSQYTAAESGLLQITSPLPRGRCNVVNVHATAVTPDDGQPGPPHVVATADWGPTDPDSQRFNTWVVLQLADGTPPQSPTNIIRVLQVVD